MRKIIGLLGIIIFGFTLGMIVWAPKGAPAPDGPMVMIGAIILFALSVYLFRSKSDPFLLVADQQETKELNRKLWREHSFTVAGLSVVLIAVYTVLCSIGAISIIPTAVELYNVGAGFGESAAHGQAWRLFTQIFLHANVEHLISNLAGLWATGRLLEFVAGRKSLVSVFLAGGLLASVTSAIVNPSVVSVGASGAIFALYGALFSSYFFNSKMRTLKIPKSVWWLVGYQVINSIWYGFQDVGIDNAAHVGGLVAGFVLMSIAYQFRSENENRIHAVFGGAVAAVAAFSLTVMPGFVKQNHSNPATLAEKTKSVVAAMGAVEDAEAELMKEWKEWKGFTAENQAEKNKWLEKEFLPKYQKLIADLKELTEAGLNERLISLKKSVQDSASACSDVYGYAIEMQRSPASEDSIKTANLHEACVGKTKERKSLIDQINGARK